MRNDVTITVTTHARRITTWSNIILTTLSSFSFQSFTVHILMLGCEHSWMMMKHRNNDPEPREGLPTDEGDLEILTHRSRTEYEAALARPRFL